MTAGATARIVLLPGAFTTAGDFTTEGFAAALNERQLEVELIVTDLGLTSVTDRSILERLRAGPLRAARAAGCESVWLAGVSLGAFVALVLAERFPGEVDGLCLIAPYLGTRIVTGEIARAGGLARWQPATAGEEDEERRLWSFLRAPNARRPPIHLGYGRGDRFADSQDLLAAALPAGSVDVIDGSHDWPTWRTLWERFLDQWPARAAAAARSRPT